MYPPWRLYKGSDKGPDRDPLGHRKGTGGTPPGSPTSQVRTPQAPARVWQVARAGILRAFRQNLSSWPLRIPAGAPPSPCRADYGLERGIFFAGTRVTFKFELKVSRGPRRGEKIDGTRSGSLRVPCGTAKKRNCPGRPILWNVTGIILKTAETVVMTIV